MKEGKTGEGGKGERTDGIEEMVGKGGRKEEGRAKKGKERVTQICLAGSADDWDLDIFATEFSFQTC